MRLGSNQLIVLNWVRRRELRPRFQPAPFSATVTQRHLEALERKGLARTVNGTWRTTEEGKAQLRRQLR
jgi:hypothetical protein